LYKSCASLAGLVLCFIACFILLVIAPLHLTMSSATAVDATPMPLKALHWNAPVSRLSTAAIVSRDWSTAVASMTARDMS